MMLVVRGCVFGVAMGLVLGVLARALMRLIAIGMTIEPEFHLGPSIAIVSLFVISAAGAAAARALDLGGWRVALLLVLTSAPLLVMGSAFASGEIGDILARDLTPPWTVELLALAGVIVGIVLVTPYAGWRVGVRGRGRAARTAPAREFSLRGVRTGG
ncbi:MAG: hypothetical protein ABIR34_10630 [Marmoricola sp.]